MNTYVRLCPKCSKEIFYTDKYTFKKAENKISVCISCGKKSIKNINHLKKISEENKKNFLGEGNPFYGKKHSKNTKEKQSLLKKDKYVENKNSMYGKSVYSIWVEKYGIEIADQKMVDYKKKQSFNSSGERNPMFGKPSPQGSGNGWSGWYKGSYFRSLLELSFMVQNDGLYQTCENKKYKIQYSIDDKVKNYFPDFIINNIVYEIKPKKLQKTFLNKIKFEAAEKWCKENNLVFSILDPKKISFEEIKILIEKEQIIFTEKYKIKYNKYLCLQK